MNVSSRLVASIFLIGLSSPVVLFADVSEATHVLQGNDRYPVVSEGQVTIYAFKPDFPYKIIGEIEAHGMAEPSALDQLDVFYKPTGEKEDMDLAMRALKRDAASMGANGVIIVKQAQVPVYDSATERRIVGAAIRY